MASYIKNLHYQVYTACIKAIAFSIMQSIGNNNQLIIEKILLPLIDLFNVRLDTTIFSGILPKIR